MQAGVVATLTTGAACPRHSSRSHAACSQPRWSCAFCRSGHLGRTESSAPGPRVGGRLCGATVPAVLSPILPRFLLPCLLPPAHRRDGSCPVGGIAGPIPGVASAPPAGRAARLGWRARRARPASASHLHRPCRRSARARRCPWAGDPPRRGAHSARPSPPAEPAPGASPGRPPPRRSAHGARSRPRIQGV